MNGLMKFLAVAAAGILATAGAWAGISQVPLTGSVSLAPPNLMFTLDDSGSMDFECLPDALCTTSTGLYVGAVPWQPGTFKNAYATYDSSQLLARRIRSAVNPLYYNPAVRYQPWLLANGIRRKAYSAGAAPPNPNHPASTVNLTVTQTTYATWCKALASCAVAYETFYPAQYYMLKPDTTGNALSDFQQVFIVPGKNSYPRGLNRDDCKGADCTYAEEIQNFSNWFTYARTRLQVAIGGTSEAFAGVPASYRVGYGTINSLGTAVDGVVTDTVRIGVRPFAGKARDSFYELLQGAASSTGGTPLRRAMDDVGQYFSRRRSGSPWANDPAAGQPVASQSSCRRSFHVLMTDGIWNGDAARTAEASTDVDSAAGPEITHADGSKWQYAPKTPYMGKGGSTLADVAMYYWNRDLQPDLANNLPAAAPGRPGNPAFWQHLVNYTIAFGVNGKLRNPADLKSLEEGTQNWGVPAADQEKPNIDDLWHAAINSQGLSKSAANAAEYANALKSIIEDIEARSRSEAGIAVTSRSFSTDTLKYVPSYDTGSWSGDVEAIALGTGARVWLASKNLPPPAERNIHTFGDAATKGVAFTSAGMDAADLTKKLGVDDASALIKYLRGDRSGEGSIYRMRASPLGDIVNAHPALVKDLVDGQYDFLSGSTPGRSTYLRFLDAKKRRAAQLFVGANDGMLHAFNADNGVETFAFVPRSVLGRVKQLADLSYSHRYFVDGPLAEVDIYDQGAAKWRNLVVGGGGAGAKNLFAVNVPVPALVDTGSPKALSPSESAPGAADILWEVSAEDKDFEELGHVLQTPEAGVLRDGRWVIVVGNGYESTSGRAQLFLIDAATGARVAALDTGVGSTAAPNGLSGVRLVRDADKRIVAAYAGDLRGNLWKFDLSSATSAAWAVAFEGKPLFKAQNTVGEEEPIMAAPTYTRHPLGGLMVFAGSGKLFDSGDGETKSERSLYGVWDKVAIGSNSDNAANALASNDLLVQQTTSGLTIGGGTGDYYALSNKAVDYGSGPEAQKRGWKIRMTIEPGQRLIYDPRFEGGRVIFDTWAPGDAEVNCSRQPYVLTLVVDPFTGAGGRDGPTFDTNSDGHVDSADDPKAVIARFSTSGPRATVQTSGSQVRFEGPGA